MDVFTGFTVLQVKREGFFGLTYPRHPLSLFQSMSSDNYSMKGKDWFRE